MRTATLFTLVWAGLPAFAAAPPVAGTTAAVELPVPAKATVVLQVNGWEKARGRLNALVEKSLPGDAKTIKETINTELSNLLDGRELKGIDPDARVLVSINDLHALGEDTTPVDVFVPVKDHAAFRDSFFKEAERKELVKKANGISSLSMSGNPVFLVEKTGYLVITASEDRANEYAGKYDILNTKRMGPDVAATFLAADVALYVDLEKINDTFGDEIKQFRGLIDFAFQNAGGNIPGLDKSQLDTVKEMLKGVFQVVEDGRAFVVGVEFRPEGLNLRLQARFDKESKTGKVLAFEVPDAHAGLGKLPSGFTEYHAKRFGPVIEETFGKLLREFAAGEDQEAAAKAVEKYDEAKKGAASKGTYSASKEADASVAITGYKDPTEVVAAQVALLKDLPPGSIYSTVLLKEKPTIKESAQTYKGVIFHQVSLVLDFEETVKKLPEPLRESTLATMKKAAKEKTSYWIGSNGQAVVQVTAADWPAAQKLLDAAESNPTGIASGDPAFQATRGQLPAEVSFLSVQETGHVMNSFANSFGSAGQSIPWLPFEIPKMNKVTAAPSFVGIAVVLKPEIGQFDLFVPTAVIGIARKAFEEK